MRFGPGYSPEQIQSDFYARQMSYSYQAMLVRFFSTCYQVQSQFTPYLGAAHDPADCLS